MKLINKKTGDIQEQHVASTLCGIRIDSVEFSKKDIDDLLSARAEHVVGMLTRLSHRFRVTPIE